MNYWDILPCELQNIVLGFTATTIQKIWRGRIATAKQSLQFVNELLIESDGSIEFDNIDTMLPRTSLIVEYCTKHANYNIGENTWNYLMIRLKQDLWENEYTGGPGAKFHNQIDWNLPILNERLFS
jgi:hypothetical protein